MDGRARQLLSRASGRIPQPPDIEVAPELDAASGADEVARLAEATVDEPGIDGELEISPRLAARQGSDIATERKRSCLLFYSQNRLIHGVMLENVRCRETLMGLLPRRART